MKKLQYALIALVLGLVALVILTPLDEIIVYRLFPDFPENQNETLKLSGLKEKASIAYDENGIPHIEAQNLSDLSYAIGLAHGRYRGFQMDLLRKFAAGRLSELLGNQKALTSTTIEFDLAMRGWAFEKKASFKESELPKEDLMILNSYAKGVNAAMQRWPSIEHRILQTTPRKWEPRDTLLVGLLQAWSLTHNWEQEALRFSFAWELGMEKAKAIYPFGPLYDYGTLKGEENVSLPMSYAPEVLQVLSERGNSKGKIKTTAFGDLMKIRPFASNAWATKKEGQLPVLNNDMHLTHSLPGLIFLQSISMPGLKAIGAAMPGLPFLISGFNGKVAWGVTSAVADVADLVIERPEDVKSEKVKINIKGEDSKSLTIRRSKNGPIFNDMYPGQLPEGAPLIAIRFKTPEVAKSMGALYRANRAQNIFELRDALMKIPAPIQNVMAADTQGNIGFFSTGSVPLRKNHRGVFPVPGWTEKYAWKGWTPKEEMPFGANPKENFLANNNNLVHNAYKNLPIFHIDAAASHRFDRINEIASPSQSPEKLRSHQMDNYLIRARLIAPILIEELSRISSLSETELEALNLLKSWDYTSSPKSPQASLFNMTYKKAAHMALNNHVSPALASSFLKQRYSPGVADLWFKNKDHFIWSGQRGKILLTAFRETISELTDKFGDRPEAWAWGKAHFIRPTHPFGKRRILSFLNLESAPLAGGFDSLWKAHFNFADKDNYQVVAGPVYRFSIDLNRPTKAGFMTDTGASGWPLSPHYGDLYEKWKKGEMISIEEKQNNWPVLELVP